MDESKVTRYATEKYVNDIREKTLASVMDTIFHETDLRSSTGGIGLLTHDKITRIDLNKQAFTMALTQFVNGKIWQDERNCDKMVNEKTK